MNKYSVAAAISACMIVLGCAPSVMINPEYKSKPMSGKHLHVVLVGPTTIDYAGNMDNEFSEEGRYGKIRTFICSTTVITVQQSSTFSSVDANPGDCKAFHPLKMKWLYDSGEVFLKVPDDKCNSASDSQSIYLFLEQTLVKSHPMVDVRMVGLIPVAAIPHKPLTITGKFVFWDPSGKKPIVWGSSSGTYENGAAVTRENWLNAVCDFALRIVKDSPFDPAYGGKK